MLVNKKKKVMSKKKALLKNIELQDKINALPELYLPMDLNSEFQRNKLDSMKQLEQIFSRTERKHVQESEFSHVLVCALTAVYYFGMKLTFANNLKYYKQRNFKKASACFERTIELLLPERSEKTIKITLKFFDDVSLWPFERFCCQILNIVLFFSRGEIKLFNFMLTDIHYVISDVPSARHRMRVLYELLKSDYWLIDKQILLPLITRLLGFFAKTGSDFIYLRKGFEVCLKRIFEKVENRQRLPIIATMLNWLNMAKLPESDVLEFSMLLDRVAQLYEVGNYCDSFYDGLIDHILRSFLSSKNEYFSLVGCRLFQRFLDRKGNEMYLNTPTIFYNFTQINLVIGKYDSGDKIFFKHHRELIHDCLLKAFKSHSQSSVNLKALYVILCCLVLEVPCGLTAAAAACLLMSVQNMALNEENLSPTSRYWMHAVVVSVMSLICWVHKSPVLYSYVNQIIYSRAQEAPQLNPPLKQVYNVGHHHVTWNKPTLFFEDWELRYGMWKHFSDKNDTRYKSYTKIKRRMIPRLDIN